MLPVCTHPARWLLILLTGLLLAACDSPAPVPETSGTLRIDVRKSPSTYYLTPDETPAGFEHDLLADFAREQGWTPEFIEENRPGRLLDRVRQRTLHLAAATLPRSVVRDHHLHHSSVIAETPVWLVQRRDARALNSPRDLAGVRIALIAGSGHTPMLQRLKRKHPKLVWHTLTDVWPEELLARLQDGEFDAVVINGLDFDPLRNAYPDLNTAFRLAERQEIVWAVSARSSQEFRNALARHIETAQRNGTLRRLHERYFGHVRKLDRSDMIGIIERRPLRLPPFRRHFQEAQTLTGLDWRLLAAIGYQESQWNPNATSPTGVRGLMMLTGDTADRMGVDNRLDPKQSILGGARYLALLKDKLPPRIAEPDRTWMALAAYNQGQGALEDARRITQARGGNPDSWADVKQALPYLSRGGYSHVMKYGYARGHEALHFAENIRNYYDMLQRLEPAYDPLFRLSTLTRLGTRDMARGFNPS